MSTRDDAAKLRQEAARKERQAAAAEATRDLATGSATTALSMMEDEGISAAEAAARIRASDGQNSRAARAAKQ